MILFNIACGGLVVVGMAFGYCRACFGEAHGGGSRHHYHSSGVYSADNFDTAAVGGAKFHAAFGVCLGVHALVYEVVALLLRYGAGGNRYDVFARGAGEIGGK